jgi:hypothetical protein
LKVKRTLIQDPAVTETFESHGVSDTELRAVENAILKGEGVTISGAGGLKKTAVRRLEKGKADPSESSSPIIPKPVDAICWPLSPKMKGGISVQRNATPYAESSGCSTR